MTELSALSKHACPASGAQAEWNASKGLLVCPYCGTRSPYEIDEGSGEIVEIELVRTLRELPEYREHGYPLWALVHKGDDRVIGFCGVKYLEEGCS